MAQTLKMFGNHHGRHIKRREYIHNYARNLMGKLGIKYESFSSEQSAVDIARLLFKQCGRDVYATIDNENDEVQGALSLCGAGSEEVKNHSLPHLGEPEVAMFQCFEGPHWLSGIDHGGALILRIASVAVIAAMADNIWKELKKARRVKTDFEHTNPYRGWENIPGGSL